ncbi:GDSL-type esterase/lipase family protein [Sporolactobacillus spathodeae]
MPEMMSLMGDRPLYVALGDSLTVGIGATFFQPNFVKLYQHSIEYYFRQPVERLSFAKNGATSEQILEQLLHPETTHAVANASFITLTAGGNDMLHASRKWLKTGNQAELSESIQSCVATIEEILWTIFEIHASNPQKFCVRVLNLYNPMPQIRETYFWLEQYNKQLASLERAPDVKIADVYHAFLGNEPMLLTLDHTHPNPLGYRIMADTAVHLGFEPVS